MLEIARESVIDHDLLKSECAAHSVCLVGRDSANVLGANFNAGPVGDVCVNKPYEVTPQPSRSLL